MIPQALNNVSESFPKDLLGSLSEDLYIHALQPPYNSNTEDSSLRQSASTTSSSRDTSPLRIDWTSRATSAMLPDVVDQSQRSQLSQPHSPSHRDFGSYIAYK